MFAKHVPLLLCLVLLGSPAVVDAGGAKKCVSPEDFFAVEGTHAFVNLGGVVQVTQAVNPGGGTAPLRIEDCNGDGVLDLFIRSSKSTDTPPVRMHFGGPCGATPSQVEITFSQFTPTATWRAFDAFLNPVDGETTFASAMNQTVHLENPGGIFRIEIYGAELCIDQICVGCEQSPSPPQEPEEPPLASPPAETDCDLKVSCVWDVGKIFVSWSLEGKDCNCDGLRIVTSDGEVLATIRGAELSGTEPIPCEDLPDGAGKLCVELLDEKGNVKMSACCKYECPQPPELEPPKCSFEVKCETVDGTVKLFWEKVGDCDCRTINITDWATGLTVAVLPGSATSFEIPCAHLPAESGTLCVRCVDPTTGQSLIGCCDYRCPPAQPDLQPRCRMELTCFSLDGKIILRPEMSGEHCACDSFVVRYKLTGQVIATFPADAFSFEIPCSDLPSPSGELCVECVDDSGNVVIRQCCEYKCPKCDLEVSCGYANGEIIVKWNSVGTSDYCLCDFVSVREVHPGAPSIIVPGASGSVSIPCEDLIEKSGQISVGCYHNDGLFFTTNSCTYECPPDSVVGGGQFPGDLTQDGATDMSDLIAILGYLFIGTPEDLPCGDGTLEEPGNVRLSDWNGDGQTNASDAIYGLMGMFLGGSNHTLGRPSECIIIEGCPEMCKR